MVANNKPIGLHSGGECCTGSRQRFRLRHSIPDRSLDSFSRLQAVRHPKPFRLLKIEPLKMGPEKCKSAWCAFTLLELLISISILGVLAALLVPMLNRSKSNACKVVDFNNLRQQTLTMQEYANDNSDVLPRPNWDDGGAPGIRSLPGWLYTPDSNRPAPARFKVETGLFWASLPKSQLYFCPLDKPSDPLFKKRPQQISSYAMNGAIVGYKRILDTPVRLSRMSPSACAFWETDEKHPRYFNDGANVPAEGVSTRHSQGAVQAAFDGRVSYVKFDTWQKEELDPNLNRLWCYPESADGR